MNPFQQRLHLNAGLLDKKPVRYLNDYGPAAALVAFEGLSQDVFTLGGKIMERWRSLGVAGMTGAEKLPFKIQCAGEGNVLRKSFLKDVSVAIMGGITALELLDWATENKEQKAPSMSGTIIGNAMLVGPDVSTERLDVFMGLVAEATCRKMHQLRKTAKIQFRYADAPDAEDLTTFGSPVLPHVIRYQGCSPALIMEVIHFVLSLCNVNEGEMLFCHHMWQEDGVQVA
jgi:hypothetical protein